MGRRSEWREQVMVNAKACKEAFLTSRIEISLERVSRDPQYREICQQQVKEEKTVGILLQKLEKEERIIIRRYYERIIEKGNYELEEAYIQGMRDCMEFLKKLGVR